jgi:N-methylhydantoinase B/oxoprolinase/acetone carboxylase alpha subunit
MNAGNPPAVTGGDPAAMAVLMARLAGVADEMSAVLRRAAYSPNIKERADCSAAVFTPGGELLAQAENIPVHLGSMPASVRAVIEAAGGSGEAATAPPLAGEHWIVNDPFAGGTHLNDITVVTPCVVAGGVVGWVANRAHHADVGGAAPGSLPADAAEVFAEGLRLPPVRLTPEVRAVVLGNSRTPAERAGDLDAQVGANVRGVARLAAVVEALGGDATTHLGAVLDYGERRMRAVLAGLPDGTWAVEDRLDSAGASPDQQHPVVIRMALTISGDAITFDFAGSDPQTAGNVNAPASVTFSSVVYALRAALDPGLPANGGCFRPVRVDAPAGSVVAALAPAAVGAGNVEVSQRVADVCLAALANVAPQRVGAASQGTMNNVLLGGVRAAGPDDGAGDGAAWVYYETIGGGQGGRPGAAGMSGIHTVMTNTRNTPVEALERAYPLRVRRYALRRDSGGAGAHPGGDGIERDLEVLADATLSLITERRVTPPWGLAGGSPGSVGENVLLRGGDEAAAEPLGDKCTVELRAGDVLRLRTPGGGGWGRGPGGEPGA